jgi:DNA-directed RNA polymerase specialized sigma subunit
MNQFLDVREFLEIGLPKISHDREIELAISIHKNFLPFKERMLSPEARKKMSLVDLRTYRKGDKDRDILIRSNMKLIIGVTKRFSTSGIELRILLDFGMNGLIRAAETYNPYKINPESGIPYKFSTHATWQILDSMSIGVSKFRVIKIPSWVINGIKTMQKVTASLKAELGRVPTDLEIACKMPPTGKFKKPFTVERLNFLRRSQFLNTIKSLDSMYSDEDESRTFDVEDSFDIWNQIESEEEREIQLNEKINCINKPKQKKRRKKKRKKRSLIIKDFSKKNTRGIQLGLKISIKKKPNFKKKTTNIMQDDAFRCSSQRAFQLSLDLEVDPVVYRSEFNCNR